MSIRQAVPADAGRIAEIFVSNYRINFYPFFRNDDFYFRELNVLDTAARYAPGSKNLQNTFVDEDAGIIRGFVRIDGTLIEKLFIEPQFQGQGIGAALLRFAVQERHASTLWVLEYNRRGMAFYGRNGFHTTGRRIVEDGWVPLLEMSCTPEEPPASPDK